MWHNNFPTTLLVLFLTSSPFIHTVKKINWNKTLAGKKKTNWVSVPTRCFQHKPQYWCESSVAEDEAAFHKASPLCCCTSVGLSRGSLIVFIVFSSQLCKRCRGSLFSGYPVFTHLWTKLVRGIASIREGLILFSKVVKQEKLIIILNPLQIFINAANSPHACQAWPRTGRVVVN